MTNESIRTILLIIIIVAVFIPPLNLIIKSISLNNKNIVAWAAVVSLGYVSVVWLASEGVRVFYS